MGSSPSSGSGMRRARVIMFWGHCDAQPLSKDNENSPKSIKEIKQAEDINGPTFTERTEKSVGENDNEFVTLIFIFMELRRLKEWNRKKNS